MNVFSCSTHHLVSCSLSDSATTIETAWRFIGVAVAAVTGLAHSLYAAASPPEQGEQPADGRMRKLVVGLGNHGMLATRHSVGMQVTNALVKRLGGVWKYERDCAGFVAAKMNHNGTEIVVAKPKLLMNINGRCVANAYRKYGIRATTDVLLVHDDLDRDFGKLSIKHGGSANGHNGVKSSAGMLQSDAMKRMRVGVGRPYNRDAVTRYVLSDFSLKEKEVLDDMVLQPAVDKILHEISPNVAGAAGARKTAKKLRTGSQKGQNSSSTAANVNAKKSG